MLDYYNGKQEEENWILTETEFHPRYLGKCESIMALGNGYLGVRSAHEEAYCKQTRDLFVAGTFNKFDKEEPTELPNIADVLEMDIYLNEERLALDSGQVLSYERKLSLKTGELVRDVHWRSPDGNEYKLQFRRFASLNNLHLIGQKVTITPLSSGTNIVIQSGINGQVTNSGAQHFHEGRKRVYDKKLLEYEQTTTQTKVDILLHALHVFTPSDASKHQEMEIGRRKLMLKFQAEAKVNESITLEKFSTIHTSMDEVVHSSKVDWNEYKNNARNGLEKDVAKGYDQLLQESSKRWGEYWEKVDVKIDAASPTSIDQLAIRFAQYHLLIMTPAHDNRFGIGAKGLTGEGYKGHSFWDSEIFIMPYFLYTNPSIARSLLEYRYLTIDGARKKAKENGYKGAMYPWEAALTGEEETPVWGAINVETGKSTKIWSGFLEQHITGDIAYAVYHYHQVTQDDAFMDECGYEMIFEAANFWASRLEWSTETNRYEINEIIGPDEYKEHVDNNAFTNYIADWTIRTAVSYYQRLQPSNDAVHKLLFEQLNLGEAYETWNNVLTAGIYLPEPNEDGIIPQDNTYLQKEIIDISPYKFAETAQTILKDYSREQVIDMQVSKQADVVMLLYLFRDMFSKEVKQKNWQYYEGKTIHDSSLSMAVHSIVATDFDDSETAYECFQRAAVIDLGQNKKSSDQGIHAASLGGVWKSIVFGFLGVRPFNGELHIHPQLPKQWKELQVPLEWRGRQLRISVNKHRLEVEQLHTDSQRLPLSIVVNSQKYLLEEKKIVVELFQSECNHHA